MVTPPRKMAERGILREIRKAINDVIDYARESAPIGGIGVRIKRTSNGSLISADIPEREQESTPGTIRRFLLKEVFDDHLRCVEYDGTEGATTLIAKPYELRKTGWNGQTVVYPLVTGGTLSILYTYLSPVYRTARITAGASAVTESQYVNPYYLPDRTIIFAAQSDNGTGVNAADEWIELSGREWARLI